LLIAAEKICITGQHVHAVEWGVHDVKMWHLLTLWQYTYSLYSC